MEHQTVGIDNKYVNLIELDPQEKLICVIRRHIVGLVSVYLTGFFIAIMVLLGSMLFAIWIDRQPDLGQGGSIGLIATVLGIVLSALVLFFTYVAGYVFRNSVIIVTTDKIAQVIYRNLIDRKISQLALGDLQDTTVEQKGVLARLFKYGTLIIETAGEQNNFIFTFTPYSVSMRKRYSWSQRNVYQKVR